MLLSKIAALNNDHVNLDITPHEQEKDYTCGPAAVKTIEPSLSESELATEAKSHATHGTKPPDLIAAARGKGLTVVEHHNMTLEQLKSYIDQGKPVVCPIQQVKEPGDEDGDSKGHYITAMGYNDHSIRYSDPADGSFHELPNDEFIKRWHDADASGTQYSRYGMAIWRDGALDKDPTPGGVTKEDWDEHRSKKKAADNALAKQSALLEPTVFRPPTAVPLSLHQAVKVTDEPMVHLQRRFPQLFERLKKLPMAKQAITTPTVNSYDKRLSSPGIQQPLTYHGKVENIGHIPHRAELLSRTRLENLKKMPAGLRKLN